TAGLDKAARVWEWHTGRPLTPSLPVGHEGGALAVLVSPDGSRVIVSGFTGGIHLFDLAALDRADHLHRGGGWPWGELLSGQRIQEGGNVSNLTATEWLQRWRDLRTRRPRPVTSENDRRR